MLNGLDKAFFVSSICAVHSRSCALIFAQITHKHTPQLAREIEVCGIYGKLRVRAKPYLWHYRAICDRVTLNRNISRFYAVNNKHIETVPTSRLKPCPTIQAKADYTHPYIYIYIYIWCNNTIYDMVLLDRNLHYTVYYTMHSGSSSRSSSSNRNSSSSSSNSSSISFPSYNTAYHHGVWNQILRNKAVTLNLLKIHWKRHETKLI